MNDLTGIAVPPLAETIYEESRQAGFRLVSEPLTGCLLRTLVSAKPGGSFLELGTGTGAATAWIVDGMTASSSLVTVESDERLLSIARRHLGSDARVELVCADGHDFLRRSDHRRFDLIFADTWPGKYENPELALAMVAPGGFYVIDDMEPQDTWPPGHGVKVAGLISLLESRRDLRVTKLTWASGIIIAARVSER